MRRKSSQGQAKSRRPNAKRRGRGQRSDTSAGAIGTTSRDKVRAYRARMHAKGLRLVQLWLPDIRTEAFAAEAQRQSRLAKASPFAAADQAWVDAMADWASD
jgi:hypothetical protein